MSVRRESSTFVPAPAARHPVTTAVAAAKPQTIGDRLGIEQSAMPPKWPRPFEPQYREVPEVSDSVVEDMFDGYDADPSGAFRKKKAAAGAKLGANKAGLMANLKAAKSKADEVARKAASGARKADAVARKAASGALKADAAARKAASGVKGMAFDKKAGMQKFDYRVINSNEFTGVLAVVKKTNGGVEAKNTIKAFKKYTHSEVIDRAEEQEKQMNHREVVTKQLRRTAGKASERGAPGRNAAVLGYSRVEKSSESDALFGDSVVNLETPAGASVPTLVKMSQYDTNGSEDMMPITGLVVEPFDAAVLIHAKDDVEKVTVTMQEIAEITEGQKEARDKGTLDFEYALCVHGLHVGQDKLLSTGLKILVPENSPSDIASYGIATDNGIESALYHAIKGDMIDLLYLWTCFRLVQGVHALAQWLPGRDKAQKAALKELLGTSMGKITQYAFEEDFEGDDFGELNQLHISVGN